MTKQSKSSHIVNKTRKWGQIVVALILAGLTSAHAQTSSQPGANYRWFEIEVLVFKQDAQSHAGDEYFPLQLKPIPLGNAYDLIGQQAAISATINAQLTACENAQDDIFPVLLPQDVNSLNTQIRERAQRDIFCRDPADQALVTEWYQNINVLPDLGPRQQAEVVINGPGGDIYQSQQPFLLSSGEHEMSSIRQRLASQADKSILLHTSWRQPVVARNQGRKIRLFGGENFTRDYDYLGFQKETQEFIEPSYNPDVIRADSQPSNTPLQRIQQLLTLIDNGSEPFARPDTQASGLPDRPAQYPAGIPTDVWEFDGLMHIYLVGNYLHINGEFNLRDEVRVPLQATSLEAQADAALRAEESTASFLRGYYFNQLRRVISHEKHYFDHPEFGVIVEIRRTDLSSRR